MERIVMIELSDVEADVISRGCRSDLMGSRLTASAVSRLYDVVSSRLSSGELSAGEIPAARQALELLREARSLLRG